MKRLISFLLCLIMLCTFHASYFAHRAEAAGEIRAGPEGELCSDPGKNKILLPQFLEEIGEAAFEGVAAETVVSGEHLVRIGDGAFSEAQYMTDVYLPPSVLTIGDHAFPENPGLTIHGVEGSYAETWAREHQVAFTPASLWSGHGESEGAAHPQVTRIALYYRAINARMTQKLHERAADEGKSMRPQERPELNVIDYRFP